MIKSSQNSQFIPEPDALACDPFFRLKHDGEWNACIGRQGDEENYLDGYIEAAMELANAIIERQLLDKRDTLVLPVLYNARHALELALKFTSERLLNIGVLENAIPRNHNIKAHLEALKKLRIGDEELSRCLGALEPFVASLSNIDNDGQELRYHLNRFGNESLSTYSLANLEVIRDSLKDLSTIISRFKHRTIAFIEERQTNTYTERCSRRDLMAIASMLPPIESWKEPVFDEMKDLVKARFGLSGRQFSKALDVVKGNRETKAILGVESALHHLSDELTVWVVQQWRTIHGTENAGESDDIHLDYFDERRFERMKKYLSVKEAAIVALQHRLTQDELADLETIFYLGRDGWFSEYYEQRLATIKKEHAAANDFRAEISHLMEKTNFLAAVRESVMKLGRVSLAGRLASL